MADSAPRLTIAADRIPNAVLNAGWWPRSWDAAAELPSLIAALTEHYGPIRRLILNSRLWQADRDRTAAAAGTTAIRWFSTAEPGLLVAITDLGDQINVLVVPPGATDSSARAAMDKAVGPSNRLTAPAILATLTIPAPTQTEPA